MKINTYCRNCNLEFYIPSYRYVADRNFFCSKLCEGKFRKDNCTTKQKCSCVICGQIMLMKKSEFVRRSRNGNLTCSRTCSDKRKTSMYSGRSNPNCKYKSINDSFFDNIDSEQKAYVLGWIASDGTISVNGAIRIEIKSIDSDIIKKIGDIISPQLPIRFRNTKFGQQCVLTVSSTQMSNSICKHLGIKPGKKDKTVNLPKLSNVITIAFLRGYFDGDGTVRDIEKRKYLDCSIASQSRLLKQSICEFCKNNNIYSSVNKWNIYFSGKDAMKFLNLIYDKQHLYLSRKFEMYDRWKNSDKYKCLANQTITK